jgi:hypothetical protein
MGWAFKVQSKQVQNPTKSPFLNVDLVWVKGKNHVCRNPSLGLVAKAKAWKVVSQDEAMWAKRKPGSHISCSHECKKVWGSEPSHSQVNSPFVSWSPKWIPRSSEHDCKGQNPLVWRFFYIIGKLLKLRCLKWARFTHLDIWNTSYGQKKR